MRHLLAIAILFVAVQAHAFSKEWPGAAAIPIPGSCSGCQAQTDLPAATIPTGVMHIPGGGGAVLYRMRFPNEATSGAITGFVVNVLREQASDADDHYCIALCAGVVKDGQDASNLNISACASLGLTGDYTDDQWNVLTLTPGPVTPLDTAAVSCSGTSCNNAELWVAVTQLPDGLFCPGGTSDSSGILDVSPIFQ